VRQTLVACASLIRDRQYGEAITTLDQLHGEGLGSELTQYEFARALVRNQQYTNCKIPVLNLERGNHMREGTIEVIGGILGSLIFIGGGVFGNCVLWRFAVGTGLLPGLIAGGILGGLSGMFVGLSTLGSRNARQGAGFMLMPIFTILAIIGGIVWVARALIMAA